MAPTPADILDAAAAALVGPLVRTSASVIGKRAGERLIVATTSFSYTVTALVSDLRFAFTVHPRGWLKKTLVVEGAPPFLVEQTLEAPLFARISALAPHHVELGRMGLRLEQRYGTVQDVAEVIDLVTVLARRARLVDSLATRDRVIAG
jgi:hypothetical protein